MVLNNKYRFFGNGIDESLLPFIVSVNQWYFQTQYQYHSILFHPVLSFSFSLKWQSYSCPAQSITCLVWFVAHCIVGCMDMLSLFLILSPSFSHSLSPSLPLSLSLPPSLSLSLTLSRLSCKQKVRVCSKHSSFSLSVSQHALLLY